MLSFLKPKIAIRHCITGQTASLGNLPIIIGGIGANFEVEESDRALCEISEELNVPTINSFNGTFVLSGLEKSKSPLQLDEDYSLIIDNHLLLFRLTKKSGEWQQSRAIDEWRIVDKHSNILAGPGAFQEIIAAMPNMLRDHPQAIVHQLHSSAGFYLKATAKVLGIESSPSETREAAPKVVLRAAAPVAGVKRTPLSPPPMINSENGEFTCPACWLKFDRGDVLHVSVHASLKGDPLLGEEAMIRFSANRFNDKGQALDAMGIPAAEVACPHCRRRTPPSFLDIRQHIFSIVGAPSAGKSYYLSVLVKMLQNSLYRNFKVAFFDGDPSENIRLTEMKNKLFSATSAADARIAKTDLEGDMYLEVPRLGRLVRMPKPFTFNLSPESRPDQATSVVFYDNAGEHFEPTRNSAESPGAQHIAAASAIFFLFDPTYNLEFRRRLANHHDPQIKDQRFDQQDTLLAEMNARVKTLLGVDFREKIRTPLALMVGKCDVWLDLVGGREKLRQPIKDGLLDMAAVKHNSEVSRSLLLEISPQIVANAEAISEQVMYFPVSPFGCSPEIVGKDPKGQSIFSPDPNKLDPILVDVPTLWVLSMIEPSLVPSVEAF